ncbi:exopolysaccharide biosynthesis protein [Taylorella equigenitalis]|uniref:Exopolysaccharide biosynthesis protein-like protein n=3 Tax=Taylorella equigenitalis TaxID=29575 RepID=A0A654KGS2_TAYEM|nr:Exopolysaccharide biosynthesis protein-like protein [Taylorella equigenitalis MCE9]KGK33602.1 exopolysaccharide biosynthesis protein [Taylorella equigenitalis]KOS59269.1 exopolysaccharide biosynthesis protein [Taylorella equigenitalis]
MINRMVILLTLFFVYSLPHAKAVSPCIDYSTKNEKRVHILAIDLSCPNIKIIGTPEGEADTTSSFALKNNVTVAINGTFFDENRSPMGLNVTSGLHIKPYKDTARYSFFACTKEKICFIEPSNSISTISLDWDFVISGWQTLKNGKFYCETQDQTSKCMRNGNYHHPRTALGLSKDGKILYMIVVEGRQLDFRGYTLSELAQEFKKLDVPLALNLDGGGSTTMVVKGVRVNRLPSGQFFIERSVANHIGIIDSTPN